MKHFITFSISVILVLSIYSTSLASVTVYNDTSFVYMSLTGTNAYWGDIYFNNKINDSTSANLSIKYLYDGVTTQNNITIDTCYISYDVKPQIGTFTLGYFSYDYGGLFGPYVLENTIPTLKSFTGLRLAFPVAKDVNAKVGCFYHEQIINPLKKPTVYALGLDYTTKNFGVGGNLVQPSGLDLCYSVNGYFQPNNIIKTYLHYGSDQKHDVEEIVGLLVTLPAFPLAANVEYNFDHNPTGSNLFGCNLAFKVDKNSTLIYTRSLSTYNKSDLKLTVTW
jgi:hypothetical protein